MSGRGFHRSWRVARTLADLAGREAISADDVLEALGYRVELGAAA
jgi:magnesium chelatase family protein